MAKERRSWARKSSRRLEVLVALVGSLALLFSTGRANAKKDGAMEEGKANPKRPVAQLGTWFESLVLLGYMALIYYLSSQPVLFQPISLSHIDKVYHFGAYFVLGALWARVVFRWSRSAFWGAWCGGVFGSFYGISDELHQFYVPGRSAEVGDIFADTAGAVVGAVLVALWLFHRSSK